MTSVDSLITCSAAWNNLGMRWLASATSPLLCSSQQYVLWHDPWPCLESCISISLRPLHTSHFHSSKVKQLWFLRHSHWCDAYLGLLGSLPSRWQNWKPRPIYLDPSIYLLPSLLLFSKLPLSLDFPPRNPPAKCWITPLQLSFSHATQI